MTTEQALRSALGHLVEIIRNDDLMFDGFPPLETAKKALSLPNDEGWIKVEEGCEMPEDCEEVLVCYGINLYNIWYLAIDGYWYWYESDEIGWAKVKRSPTHWKRITPPTK